MFRLPFVSTSSYYRCARHGAVHGRAQGRMTHTLVVRTPRGTEYWYAAGLPPVGPVIERDGQRYVVTRRDDCDGSLTVVLEADALADEPHVGARVAQPS